ncbi:MAG: hypothetical protein MUP36_02905 [Demequinaceae bacterium]|nr:hypothetical protein [Demequinaceae bacterium]
MKRRALLALISGALATSFVTVGATTAAARDECGVTGYMSFASESTSLYEPGGQCYYALLQAKYYDVNNHAIVYYKAKWARLNWPNWPYYGWTGSTSMWISGGTLPTYYDVYAYRGCTDTYSNYCSYSSWIYYGGNYPLP